MHKWASAQTHAKEKRKSITRQTSGRNPKAGKIRDDWKEVIKKAILRKFPDTRLPED
jgi:hypothetical protein